MGWESGEHTDTEYDEFITFAIPFPESRVVLKKH